MITASQEVQTHSASIAQFEIIRNALRTPKSEQKNYERFLVDSINGFFDWYLSYSEAARNGRVYSKKKLSEILTQDRIDNVKDVKEFLLKNFLISEDYIKYLRAEITEVNVATYIDKLHQLANDLVWLISEYNQYQLKSIKSIWPGRRKPDSAVAPDFHISALNLFHVESQQEAGDHYIGDTTPAVVNHIWRLFESYAQKVLGYTDVLDQHGNSIDEITQVSWDFIATEVRGTNPRISLPFEALTMRNIATWANGYTHTTYQHNGYIQFWVLREIYFLFGWTNTKEIRDHNKYLPTNIKISDYNGFKSDFEAYLTARIPGSIIKWDEIKNVGALIISL